MFLNIVFFNPLLPSVVFLYHQETSENQSYSYVVRVYKKQHWAVMSYNNFPNQAFIQALLPTAVFPQIFSFYTIFLGHYL